MNVTSDLKYEILSDEGEKEEGKPISSDTPLTSMHRSVSMGYQRVWRISNLF